MYIRSRLIVLQTIRYSDEALIADCFAEGTGRVALMVRISHSTRAAVRYTLFQPLAVLDVEWKASAREGSIVHPRSATVAMPLATLHFDPIKSSLSFFVAEFLNHALRNERIDAGVFEYIVSAIAWLDTAEAGYANFHVVFLLRLTRFFGITPDVTHYATDAILDLREGVYTSSPPLHDEWLAPDEARRFYDLLHLDLATMGDYAMPRAVRNAALRAVLKYYRVHLTGFPTLKSVDVLSTLFD